jgi:hypothetical protein
MTDTRSEAREWFEQRVPAGASVLVQPYSVQLRPSRAALSEALTQHLGSPERATVRFQRELALDPYPAPAYRVLYLGTGGLDVDKIYLAPSAFDAGDLGLLRAAGITYVVLKQYNEPDPSTVGLRAALRRTGHLEAQFSPYRDEASAAQRAATAPFLHNTDARIAPALERPGPIIEIWNVD